MNESLELLKRKIKVIDCLMENPRLNVDKGKQIAGDYWISIKESIEANCRADCGRDIISCIWKDKLISYKAICSDEIKSLENEDYDRELRNKDHRTAITANIIALIAFLLSIFAATGVPQIWFKNLRIWIGLEE